MVTAAAANASMMTVMPVTVVMLVMLLQRVEAARRTAKGEWGKERGRKENSRDEKEGNLNTHMR